MYFHTIIPVGYRGCACGVRPDEIAYYDVPCRTGLDNLNAVKPVAGNDVSLVNSRSTDSVIVSVKDADAEKKIEVDAEASFEEVLEKVTAKVKTEVNAEFEVKMAESAKEITALKAKIGSKDFKAEGKEQGGDGATSKKTLNEILRG